MFKGLHEVYNYREMLISMIRKELRGKYKASILGFMWSFLTPLFQMLVYIVVFSYILRSGVEHFAIFLLVSLMPWNFFSASITNGATCVVNQGNLVKKIYFPRIILPLSFVTSVFINMLITFVFIFAVLFISGFGINLMAIAFLPVVMVAEYMLAFGMCTILSAVAVFFRDLEYIMGILSMAWMYLTPIMYSVDAVPENLKLLFYLNPMTSVTILYQQILYHKCIPVFGTLFQAFLVGVVVLSMGIVLFNKMQRKFAEEL